MLSTLKEIDRVDLINIERLAHILKGLSEVEFENLEILLDKEASKIISQSLKELEAEDVPVECASPLLNTLHCH